MEPLRTINRSAFVVRPREPYLRWAASIDSSATDASEALRSRAAVYLVPEDPMEESETPALDDYFATIFMLELEAWAEDEALWPKHRDFVTFQRWFEVTGESIVVDLAPGPIRTEKL